MITESVRRYIRDETLDFHLVAVKDPLSSGLDGPRRLMQAVATKARGLMPALASLNKKRQPFSVDAVENLLAAAPPKKPGTLFLTRSAPEVSCRFMFLGNLSPIGMLLTMQVPMDHFDGPRGQAHAGEVVELVTEIARVCPLLYGFAHAKGDLRLGGDPHVSDPLAAFKIYEAHWLNVYGRAMVENIGHDRVLLTPAEKLEALPDGGVLLTTSPTPADFATDGSRVAQARALCHLCPDIPFEDALARPERQARARGARLGPGHRRSARAHARHRGLLRALDRGCETQRLSAARGHGMAVRSRRVPSGRGRRRGRDRAVRGAVRRAFCRSSCEGSAWRDEGDTRIAARGGLSRLVTCLRRIEPTAL